MLEADGALDALTLTGGSSFENPMYLFRGEAPIQEMAATFPAALRPGFKLLAGRFFREYPFEEAYFLPYARQFRAALTMPLILLGGINRLDTIEHALAEGFAFVQMARALLREPDLVHRMQADAGYESLCIHCNKCMPTIYRGTRCVLVPSDRRIRARQAGAMTQQPIELILLKQVASQLALPIFLVEPRRRSAVLQRAGRSDPRPALRRDRASCRSSVWSVLFTPEDERRRRARRPKHLPLVRTLGRAAAGARRIHDRRSRRHAPQPVGHRGTHRRARGPLPRRRRPVLGRGDRRERRLLGHARLARIARARRR